MASRELRVTVDMTKTEEYRDLLVELTTAKAILAQLADDEPCHFDHHGDCQAHAAGKVDGRCSMVVTRELLAAEEDR